MLYFDKKFGFTADPSPPFLTISEILCSFLMAFLTDMSFAQLSTIPTVTVVVPSHIAEEDSSNAVLHIDVIGL